MPLRPVQVNFKASDDVALGRFWADALGWATEHEAPGVTNLEPRDFEWPDASSLTIDLVAVPDVTEVAYRAHLDLATSSEEGRQELLAHLLSLGATPADIGQGDVPWTVLADPEGNLFCVLEPREKYQGTGPIAAVVVDCADPRALAEFWAAATDWAVTELADDTASLRSSIGVGPYLEFVKHPDPASDRHRLHLDLLPYAGDDQAAEVARLHALGAVDVDLGQGPDASWRILADPEANEFCVLRPR